MVSVGPVLCLLFQLKFSATTVLVGPIIWSPYIFTVLIVHLAVLYNEHNENHMHNVKFSSSPIEMKLI